MIKIEALKNYTIPYYGNKRIQPYGDLVISDGECRKTCKIQDDGAKQYITFNRKRYYVRNAGYCSFIYYNKKEIDGIYGLHSAYGNKVESFKFYKNGKWEVKFISEEEAQKFFDMYCKLEA